LPTGTWDLQLDRRGTAFFYTDRRNDMALPNVSAALCGLTSPVKLQCNLQLLVLQGPVCRHRIRVGSGEPFQGALLEQVVAIVPAARRLANSQQVMEGLALLPRRGRCALSCSVAAACVATAASRLLRGSCCDALVAWQLLRCTCFIAAVALQLLRCDLLHRS